MLGGPGHRPRAMAQGGKSPSTGKAATPPWALLGRGCKTPTAGIASSPGPRERPCLPTLPEAQLAVSSTLQPKPGLMKPGLQNRRARARARAKGSCRGIQPQDCWPHVIRGLERVLWSCIAQVQLCSNRKPERGQAPLAQRLGSVGRWLCAERGQREGLSNARLAAGKGTRVSCSRGKGTQHLDPSWSSKPALRRGLSGEIRQRCSAAAPGVITAACQPGVWEPFREWTSLLPRALRGCGAVIQGDNE